MPENKAAEGTGDQSLHQETGLSTCTVTDDNELSSDLSHLQCIDLWVGDVVVLCCWEDVVD